MLRKNIVHTKQIPVERVITSKILNYLEFQVISNLVKYADSGIKDYKELCQKSMKIYENIINHKSKGKRKQTMYVLNKNKGKAY